MPPEEYDSNYITKEKDMLVEDEDEDSVDAVESKTETKEETAIVNEDKVVPDENAEETTTPSQEEQPQESHSI